MLKGMHNRSPQSRFKYRSKSRGRLPRDGGLAHAYDVPKGREAIVVSISFSLGQLGPGMVQDRTCRYRSSPRIVGGREKEGTMSVPLYSMVGECHTVERERGNENRSYAPDRLPSLSKFRSKIPNGR